MLTLPLVLALAAAPIAEDPTFQKALALYEDLEFEQAILQFQALAIRTDLEKDEKAQVLMWLGVSYGQTGNLDAARQHFALALAEDPDAQVPVRVSPDLNEIVQEERKKAEEQAAANPPDEPPDDPPPDDPPPPKDPPDDAPPDEGGLGAVWWTVGGVGLLGGALAAVAAGSLGAWSFVMISEAANPVVPQRSAKELQDSANLALTGAIISGSVAVVLFGAGAAGLGLAFSE